MSPRAFLPVWRISCASSLGGSGLEASHLGVPQFECTGGPCALVKGWCNYSARISLSKNTCTVHRSIAKKYIDLVCIPLYKAYLTDTYPSLSITLSPKNIYPLHIHLSIPLTLMLDRSIAKWHIYLVFIHLYKAPSTTCLGCTLWSKAKPTQPSSLSLKHI